MTAVLDTSTLSQPSGCPALVERLVTQHGASWVDAARIDAFLRQPGDGVLLFTGDPVRFPEGVDVAVVLPELQAAYPGRWRLGVVPRYDEDALAARFGSQRWPALVFVRDGQYVATVAGMHDWTDFVQKVGQALAQPASRPPIPLHAPHTSTLKDCA
jgi:hydrogenase-1 operon protein HyaE